MHFKISCYDTFASRLSPTVPPHLLLLQSAPFLILLLLLLLRLLLLLLLLFLPQQSCFIVSLLILLLLFLPVVLYILWLIETWEHQVWLLRATCHRLAQALGSLWCFARPVLASSSRDDDSWMYRWFSKCWPWSGRRRQCLGFLVSNINIRSKPVFKSRWHSPTPSFQQTLNHLQWRETIYFFSTYVQSWKERDYQTAW